MNGMKFDQGKPRVDLIDPRFLLELGEVLSLYDENNEPAVEPKRYKADALRRMYQYCAGEKVDKESGKSHLVHAACNLMFLYWSDKNEVRSESDGSLGDA